MSIAKIPLEDKELFALYNANCMQCKHLSETGSTAFVECHYSKGNTQCPAAEVRFVVVGEAVEYAKRVLRARDKRLSKREARLMQYVAKQSKAFRAKFYDALENGGNL